MDLQESLRNRRSIRAFSQRPIPSDLLNSVLADALEAPSWGNTQPYKIALATGPVLENLRDDLTRKFLKATKLQRAPLYKKLLAAMQPGVLPDGDYSTQIKYPEELMERYRETGKGLYRALGIGRNEREKRDAQMARNFCFFDAPVGLFVFAHESLGMFGALDAGIFVQSLALSAHSRGLGTCIQAALGTWRSPLQRHFNIDAGYKLLCGISLGYPEQESVNDYKPTRKAVSELLLKPMQ